MKNKLISNFFQGLLITAAGLFGCNNQSSTDYPSAKGYNFNKPERFAMKDELTEISGIAFKDGNSDTMYAEQDEDGKLFHFHLGDDKILATKFNKKGDYEDVSICNNRVIMLKSNGTFYTFPVSETSKEQTDSVQEFKKVLPDGEYEGMCADETQKKIYVLCKNCKDDKQTKKVSGYIFDLDNSGTLKQAGEFSVDVKQVDKTTGEKKVKLEPSGMARNPLTHEWYLLSSINKMLIVADANWQVTNVYPLYPKTFLQPEGITFDSKGNLYISNEGDELSKGNILKFNYDDSRK